MEKIEEIFGAIIRERRKKLNMSQETLAFESGLDRSFVSHIERGQKQPTLITILSIAKALKTNTSSIFQELEEKISFTQFTLTTSQEKRDEDR